MSHKGVNSDKKPKQFNFANELALTTLDSTGIAIKFLEEYIAMGGSPAEVTVARVLKYFIRQGLIGTTKKTLNHVVKGGERGSVAINHGLVENIADVCIKKTYQDYLKLHLLSGFALRFGAKRVLGVLSPSAAVFIACELAGVAARWTDPLADSLAANPSLMPVQYILKVPRLINTIYEAIPNLIKTASGAIVQHGFPLSSYVYAMPPHETIGYQGVRDSYIPPLMPFVFSEGICQSSPDFLSSSHSHFSLVPTSKTSVSYENPQHGSIGSLGVRDSSSRSFESAASLEGIYQRSAAIFPPLAQPVFSLETPALLAVNKTVDYVLDAFTPGSAFSKTSPFDVTNFSASEHSRQEWERGEKIRSRLQANRPNTIIDFFCKTVSFAATPSRLRPASDYRTSGIHQTMCFLKSYAELATLYESLNNWGLRYSEEVSKRLQEADSDSLAYYCSRISDLKAHTKTLSNYIKKVEQNKSYLPRWEEKGLIRLQFAPVLLVLRDQRGNQSRQLVPCHEYMDEADYNKSIAGAKSLVASIKTLMTDTEKAAEETVRHRHRANYPYLQDDELQQLFEAGKKNKKKASRIIELLAQKNTERWRREIKKTLETRLSDLEKIAAETLASVGPEITGAPVANVSEVSGIAEDVGIVRATSAETRAPTPVDSGLHSLAKTTAETISLIQQSIDFCKERIKNAALYSQEDYDILDQKLRRQEQQKRAEVMAQQELMANTQYQQQCDSFKSFVDQYIEDWSKAPEQQRQIRTELQSFVDEIEWLRTSIIPLTEKQQALAKLSIQFDIVNTSYLVQQLAEVPDTHQSFQVKADVLITEMRSLIAQAQSSENLTRLKVLCSETQALRTEVIAQLELMASTQHHQQCSAFKSFVDQYIEDWSKAPDQQKQIRTELQPFIARIEALKANTELSLAEKTAQLEALKAEFSQTQEAQIEAYNKTQAEIQKQQLERMAYERDFHTAVGSVSMLAQGVGMLLQASASESRSMRILASAEKPAVLFSQAQMHALQPFAEISLHEHQALALPREADTMAVPFLEILAAEAELPSDSLEYLETECNLKRHFIRRNKDSLYQSVLIQMQLEKHALVSRFRDLNPHHLRLVISEYIGKAENSHYFTQHFPAIIAAEGGVNAYCAKIRDANHPGDALVLAALSIFLQRQIMILSLDGAYPFDSEVYARGVYEGSILLLKTPSKHYETFSTAPHPRFFEAERSIYFEQ